MVILWFGETSGKRNVMEAWIIVGYVIWALADALDGDVGRIPLYWATGWLLAGIFMVSGVVAEGIVVILAAACSACLIAAIIQSVSEGR